MSSNEQLSGRRGLLAYAGRLSVAGAGAAILAPPARAATSHLSPAEARTEATAEKVVDALEGAYGVHRGERRNHTKGVGALGSFVGNPEVAAISRSVLFSGATIDVVARFSVAGGDPEASDAERSPRGLGLEFRLPDGGLHHITMIHTPMFFAAVPQTFLDKFVALAIDPATGKPNMARFKAFVASHPDNAGQAKFLQDNSPPASYANCAFYGIHTFRFINRENRRTNVRFRFVPQDGERQLTDGELETAPRNFLERALMEQLQRGPARWDMVLTIGEPGDPENNPTILWPEGRKEMKAGTLTITSAAPSMQAGSYRINFDPLMMADGIAPSDDPVLLFRSPSYAISHTRRQRDL